MFQQRHQRRHRSNPDTAWTPIEYTDDGEAEVAECDYTTGAWAPGVGPVDELVVDVDSTICEVVGKH